MEGYFGEHINKGAVNNEMTDGRKRGRNRQMMSIPN